MTQNNKFINLIIKFIKEELLKSDIRTEIVKPILIYALYYIIPFLLLFIILKLLQRNPLKRLGSGKGDAEEIKLHPFFNDIDWNKVI